MEQLGGEFDLFDVALAAVKLAHETSGTSREDEEDLPEVELRTGDERAAAQGRRA